MGKHVRITFQNGESYDVPANIIAEDRATYYACLVDGHEIESDEYYAEYENSSHDYALTDWLENNMDWVDVKDYAVKVQEDESFNYEDDFAVADKEVIQK